MKTSAPGAIHAPFTFQRGTLLGYRFARNRCEISAGVLNLSDADYQLDPITYHDSLPRERTAVVRFKVTF